MLQAFAPVSIDMYLPAMPQMEQVFHTSAAAVQYTMVTFLVGFALGQSLYGPITDRFGRKPPLYWSLALFIVSSAACAFAPSIRIMSFFRLLQAIGACGGSVISRAIVRDLFPPSELRRIFSMLILVVGVSPVIAPMLGSYLLIWFGWRAAFVTQTLIGIACLAGMHFRLSESLPQSARIPLRVDTIVSAYSRLIKDRTFLGASVVCGFSSAGTFAYITSAPFVYISLYKVPPAEFGWLFGAAAAGMVAASQINGRMSHKTPLWRVLRNANLVQLAAGLLLLAAVLTEHGRLSGGFRVHLRLYCRAGIRVPERLGHRDDAPWRDRGNGVRAAGDQPVPDRRHRDDLSGPAREPGGADGDGDRRVRGRVYGAELPDAGRAPGSRSAANLDKLLSGSVGVLVGGRPHYRGGTEIGIGRSAEPCECCLEVGGQGARICCDFAAYSGIQYYQPDRIQFATQRRSNPDLASVGALDPGAHATPGVISIVGQQTLLEGRTSH